MKNKNRFKGYLTTKPKINLSTLIIILIFLKYVTPMMLLFSLPLVLGTITPDISYEKTEEIYNNMAERLAESFSNIMMRMYEIGQELSEYSLLIRIAFYGMVWITYIALATFVFYLFRLVIYYGLTHQTRKKQRRSMNRK
jgi:hypothetical protein